MPPRQQPRIADTSAAPYRSIACHIGTHPACTEFSPASLPVDLPVIYEACDCPFHTARDQSGPPEVAG
jgi:hypothetical protein